MVVYQSVLGGDYFARPIEMFASLVDKEKYPDAKQEFRMELIEENSKPSNMVGVYCIFDY